MHWDKSKISMLKIGKYFREISVVVIGVAITLLAGYWINTGSIKNDVALNLNAIKIELERNAIAFEKYANLLHKSTRYADYVQSHDEKSISQDSIRYYSYTDEDGIGWGDINSQTVLITNAFEMLKTSGTMRYIADKELLGNIWEVYTIMENTQKSLDESFQWKRELRIIELTTERGTPVPNRIFYSLGASHRMELECRQVSEIIKNMLSEWE